MSRPLHLPGMFQIKRKANAAGDQFVGNGPVIDTMNRYQASSRTAVVELVANWLERGDVHNRQAEPFRTEVEIGISLLMQRVDFSQHNVFRIMLTKDGAPEQLPIGLLAESAEKDTQRLRQIEDFAVS